METLLDVVVGGFLAAIEGLTRNVAPYGIGLLGALAIAAYFFRYAPYVSSTGAGLGDALAGLLLLMLGLGLTQWILLNIIPMADALYQAAITMGLGATGSTVSADQLRNPSFILQLHTEVTRPIEDFILGHIGFLSVKNWPTVAAFWLGEMTIYVVFVGIALHVGMIVIEFYFAVFAASILLPCVVFAPSTFLGEWVVGWVLGNTVRVMLVTAVVGIAVPLFDVLVAPAGMAGRDPRWVEILGVVAASGLFGLIAWQVPGRAANLVGHGLSLSASSIAGAAASGMHGIALAGSAIRGTSRLLQRA